MNNPAPRRGIGAAGFAVVAAVLAGWVSASVVAAQPPTDRRLSDAYRALMTPEQEAAYLAEPTVESRLAYARTLGLDKRYERLTSNDKKLVMNQEIEDGMSSDAVLLAWGDPDERSLLTDGHEQWLYDSATRPYLEAGFTYWLYVRDGKLTSYWSELVDAPDSGDVPK